MKIRIFAKESKSLPKDWCQNFCNSIVLSGLKLCGKGANFDEKMPNFVKFKKAMLRAENQSPGPKRIKIKQNSYNRTRRSLFMLSKSNSGSMLG